MLQKWLAPVTVESFVQRYLGKAPYARPGSAEASVPLLDWEGFEAVLAAEPAPDVLVASNGHLLPVPSPRSLAEARRLMRQGFGIAIRRSERQSPIFAEVQHAFEGDLPGEVQVQLYATPAGSQTFGWHFDFEDVFAAQTAGIKEYLFRENTVARDIPFGPRPDFSVIRNETSTLLSATLVPGDWLYIPRRWWHLVRSVQDSLSISVGVFPANADSPEAPAIRSQGPRRLQAR